jgi:hypothetical protein
VDGLPINERVAPMGIAMKFVRPRSRSDSLVESFLKGMEDDYRIY